MDDIAEILIPLFAIFCVIGLPIVAFMISRVLAHRERMEMIRNGIVPPVRGAGRAQWRDARAAAAVSRATGSSAEDYSVAAAQVSLRKGIRLAAVGTALLIGLSFIGYNHGAIDPGPWLLGGLIPMFIGIAQILIALASGATLGQPAAGRSGFAPPPPAAPFTEPVTPPVYDGSYTYRPGNTPELERPGSPPERR